MNRLLFVLCLVLLLLAIPAAALAVDGENIPAFDVWLQAASGPLVPALVAVLLSVIVEYIPSYERLAPKWKRAVYFGLCLIVPVLAATLRAGMGYVAWSFDPLYWHAIVYGFAAAGVGTLAHTRKL